METVLFPADRVACAISSVIGGAQSATIQNIAVVLRDIMSLAVNV